MGIAIEHTRSIEKKVLAYTCKSEEVTDLIMIEPYPTLL